MARAAGGRTDGNGFTHFFDRIDRALTPIFEAPTATFPERDVAPIAASPCPVCGHPMGEHRFERSAYDTVLECPTPERLLLRSTSSPLNEFGMSTPTAAHDRAPRVVAHR